MQVFYIENTQVFYIDTWLNKLNLSSPEVKEYIAQHRNNVNMSDFTAFQDYLVSF